MNLLDRVLPWRSSDKSRPPQPEPEDNTKTVEIAVYEATVHYRNGDTETFETFGKWGRGDTYISFNVPPVSTYISPKYDRASLKYDKRQEYWEVLSREPVLEKLEDRTYEIRWQVVYVWDEVPDWSRMRSSKWKAEVVDREVERID